MTLSVLQAEVTMPDIAPLTTAIARAAEAPLSRRRAMLAVLLADDFVERCFSEGGTGAEDVLAWRDALAARSSALRVIFALAAMEVDGVRLVIDPVAVGSDERAALNTPDYMVSVYNQGTVMRVLVVLGDERHDVHAVLAEAVAALRTL